MLFDIVLGSSSLEPPGNLGSFEDTTTVLPLPNPGINESLPGMESGTRDCSVDCLGLFGGRGAGEESRQSITRPLFFSDDDFRCCEHRIDSCDKMAPMSRSRYLVSLTESTICESENDWACDEEFP